MHRFKRILFLSDGLGRDVAALGRALDLALRNEAELAVLVLHPGLPASLAHYRETFEGFLYRQSEASLKQAMDSSGLDQLPASLKFNIEVEGGHAPEVRATRRVLRHDADLVIKAADPVEGGRGFMAMDLGLLRICPVPVWLWRQRGPDGGEGGPVAVAIDPADEGASAHELAIRLLSVAAGLATMLERELLVLSCWDYQLESYFRNRAFGGTTEEQLNELAGDERRRLRATLDTLIAEVGLDIHPAIHHVRGRPEVLIPEYVREQGVDVLVMGTLARTGIPGFLIGNTAENLLQRLDCGLLAMKPSGFVSPVQRSA